MSEGWDLDRRLAVAEQRADDRMERVIQRLRVVSILPAALAPFLYPGPISWFAIAGVALLVLNAAWVAYEQRAGGRALVPAWTSLWGDVGVALLLMAAYREEPGDAVQFLPLIMVVQAATRWGRTGGLVGGVVGGFVSAAWAQSVHDRADLDVPLETLGFRVVIFGFVGVFLGAIVADARQQRRAAEAVFSASSDLVGTFAMDGTVLAVNPASKHLLGYDPEELIGRNRDVLVPGDRPDLGPVDVDRFRREGSQLAEVQLVHRDGHRVDLEFDLLPDFEAGVVHAIGRDVSSRRRAESELRRRADHDGLTGVRNREALLQHLARELAGGRSPGLVFIDLDRFKAVNDRHGHLAGDQVLRELADRLVAVTGDDGLVARYAGDEFCIVVRRNERLEDVVARVREVLAVRVVGVEPPAWVSASMGWTEGVPGDRPEDLVGRADAAMYDDKGASPS